MTLRNVGESRLAFFGPFYKTRSGAIFGLASAEESIRDGLAFALVGRYFSLPEFEGVKVEPSRRKIHPPENLILIGSLSLYVDPKARTTSGRQTVKVEGQELQDRVRRITEESCFRLEGDEDRVVVNTVTGEVHRPGQDKEAEKLVDYGVITRVFRGPEENTVNLAGAHKLGTLGVAKVAMNESSLDAIWDAVDKLEVPFDESRPLEILVRTTFFDDLKDGVYSIDTVTAVPLQIVYDRQWVFDLTGDRRWVDQLPWDIERFARRDDPAGDVPPGGPAKPHIEIEADLGNLDPSLQKLAKELLLKDTNPIDTDEPPPPTARQERLLRELVAEVDRFRLVLVGTVKTSALGDWARLPKGHSRIRTLRKQFLLHLALCRLLGCGFRCDEAGIRAHFPKFRGESDEKKTFTGKFVGSVPGRMREGFLALLGPADKPLEYIYIDYDRAEQMYSLRLDKASLVLRLRF